MTLNQKKGYIKSCAWKTRTIKRPLPTEGHHDQNNRFATWRLSLTLYYSDTPFVAASSASLYIPK